MPHVARVFFAIDFDDTMRETIGSYISLLKRESRSHSIRWTRPENLHITLQFLAEVKMEHIPLLIEQAQEKIKAIKPSTFQLRSISLFPSPFRPRVIVAELFPQDELTKLSHVLGESIKTMGYEVEKRIYRPHVTLGRLKHVQHLDLSFITKNPLPTMPQVTLDEVVLFRSDPQPEGSQYTALERLALV